MFDKKYNLKNKINNYLIMSNISKMTVQVSLKNSRIT